MSRQMNLNKNLMMVCLAGFWLLFSIRVSAEEEKKIEEKSWTFSFYFENDLFADTDQNYTNGVKLTWISPDLTRYAESEKLPEWGLKIVRRLPFINEPGFQRNIGFSVGQNMYTPEDISRSDLIEDDRPYGGWLYLGAAFHSKNDRRLDSMEIQLGMVGPASFAEETQTFVHRLRDIPTAQGWDNQIKNEPGLAVVYERKWRPLVMGRPGGMGFDAIPHLGATLGNVYTYANAGVELRLGWNLPVDFGTSLIRPAGDTSAPAGSGDLRLSGRHEFGIHLFGALNGRVVLRDIFLDGNTFRDSHSVDKKPFVGEAVAGVSLIYGRVKLSYAQVFQTKFFDSQKDNHSFGAIAISFSY
jgi:lipid A 3-O-deacylase